MKFDFCKIKFIVKRENMKNNLTSHKITKAAPAAKAASAASASADLTQMQKVSYLIGFDMGSSFNKKK